LRALWLVLDDGVIFVRARSPIMKSLSFALLSLFVALPLVSRAETLSGKLQVDGVERTWQLFVPPSYREGTKYPLVLDFHGSGGTPEGQGRTSGFARLAAEKEFFVVNPAGKYVRSGSTLQTWNVDLDRSGVDDVRFIRMLIAHLRQHYSIDPDRIYSTGFSGGARMSSRIACDLSDLVAAVGLVGGVRFPEHCAPKHTVAILALHSEDDEVNHFERRADSPTYWPEGVNAAISHWVSYYKCAGPPSERPIAEGIVQFAYRGCAGDVVFIKSQGGGHTWPGSAADKFGTPRKFSATEEVWRFFEKHPRTE
jgi:polyhydroxybutyrate depolymerase